MILVHAELEDLPRLLRFRTDAASWLAPIGSDQWSTPFPAEHITRSIQAKEVFILKEHEDADAAATITLDRDADSLLWTPPERAEPALYVHKLTVDRPFAGQDIGLRLLNWAGTQASLRGAKWLRLDAWTSNSRLHQYYTDQGFEHIRTVHDPEVGGSGWVAQRPATPASHGFHDATCCVSQAEPSRDLERG